MENNDVIVIKLKGLSSVILPSILDNDEYLAKDHEFYMTDCKSYLMKDKNDERCGDTYDKE